MSEHPAELPERPILIVGGGFAGVRLAQRLEKHGAGHRTVLLSAENSITYSPLLPEIVGASMLPGHAVAPIRQTLKRARFMMGKATHVDLQAKRLYYRGEDSAAIDYEHLVLACGAAANLSLIPGMREHALPLKSVGDALTIRNRILERLEQAELQADPARRRWLATFLVIGGGFSGVEVAGHIMDFLRASRRYFPVLRRTESRVVVLHAGSRILPEMSSRLAAFALDRLRRRGVDVRLETQATRIDGTGVEIDPHERLHAGTVIATIGTAPVPLVRELPLEKRGGRLETAPDMSVPGQPGLWALGDCAAVPNALDDAPAPPTAQAATREAECLADNLARALEGRPTRPLAYHSQGQLAAIGEQRAVAEVYGLRFAGFFAWMLWRAVYLAKFPTLWRKVRVALEWTWSCFFPVDIAHLGFERSADTDATGRDRAA